MNDNPKIGPKIVVVGAGAFGTALAAVAASAVDSDVTLLARRREIAAACQRTGRNEDHRGGGPVCVRTVTGPGTSSLVRVRGR